jgi:hypothetical protein
VVETLDSTLTGRLRAIAEREPATEAELRKLFTDAEAGLRLLRGRVRRSDELLADWGEGPAASLTEYAAELQRRRRLGEELIELEDLLDRLQTRARELRASWLAGVSSRP